MTTLLKWLAFAAGLFHLFMFLFDGFDPLRAIAAGAFAALYFAELTIEEQARHIAEQREHMDWLRGRAGIR